MRFAQPGWLLGMLLALVVGGLLALGAFQGLRAIRRFGEPRVVQGLLTHQSGGRRTTKGVLLVLSLAACFIALAQPQYGWGTRRIPATNLDVVIALDYSKSMYARDVAPSRIERAKSEVARLISSLPGARFGAVAFAGEPMSFPLTSDGGAIAQFFRQLSPHDMPVGGTAIARALEAGRALLERDPRSSKHRRVMLLVTDGEDLEGDPVAAAEAAKAAGVSIYVVQIGGRTPEPIPDIDENGIDRGLRRDGQGRPMTTQLSAAGEEQLTKVAEVSGGRIVRSTEGDTGIDDIARALRVMMTEELSERVETVYADVYAYPLGLALVLLLVESWLAEAPRKRRRRKGRVAQSSEQGAAPSSKASAGATSAVAGVLLLGLLLGCNAESFDRLFLRNSPAVDDAISAIRTRDAGLATQELTQYLGLGECVDGVLNVNATARKRAPASFDLGLALFQVAERFGQRFGEDSGQDDPAQLARRSQQVSCALSLVRPLVARRDLDPQLRAEAAYLLGNLEFLRREYESAVAAYDQALQLIPGVTSEEQQYDVGENAAHNRAIALRRAEEQEPPEPPEPPDAGPPPEGADAGGGGDDSRDNDGEGDEQQDQDEQQPDNQDQDEQQPDNQDQNQQENQQDPSQQEEQPKDQQQDSSQKQPDDGSSEQPSQQQPPAPTVLQDERVLDQLERAPTIQQQAARAQQGRVRPSTEDK